MQEKNNRCNTEARPTRNKGRHRILQWKTRRPPKRSEITIRTSAIYNRCWINTGSPSSLWISESHLRKSSTQINNRALSHSTILKMASSYFIYPGSYYDPRPNERVCNLQAPKMAFTKTVNSKAKLTTHTLWKQRMFTTSSKIGTNKAW